MVYASSGKMSRFSSELGGGEGGFFPEVVGNVRGEFSDGDVDDRHQYNWFYFVCKAVRNESLDWTLNSRCRIKFKFMKCE